MITKDILSKYLIVLYIFLIAFVPMTRAQQKDWKGLADSDPVLRAMNAELVRSKAGLKIEGMAAPYYIEYRVTDTDQYTAEAAFGALRTTYRARSRVLRVSVRVGDYKQDSHSAKGDGVVAFIAIDNDILSLRHEIWLATDRAYKAATASLTAKQTQLKQFTVDQPVDDFAHAVPLQSVEPLVKLDEETRSWTQMLQDGSELYKKDSRIESFDASLKFQAVNRYFVNSEGSVVRSSEANS